MKQIKMEIKNKKAGADESKVTRVAAYCRVSTLMDEQELSYESQCAYYQNLIESRENMELVGIYGDQGFSGLHADKRPEFQRLIADCTADKVDLVMVKSISRFSRNTIDCQSYLKLLKEHGVTVFFEKEGLYSTDTQCELILKLLAAAAQEESNSISQTIKWANEKNCESGYPTRTCCYGYVKAKRSAGEKHIWLIDEEKAKRIRLMFELADQGESAADIAKALRKYEKEHGVTARWNTSNVRARLHNEAYKGDLLTGKTYTPDILSGKRMKNNGQSPQYYIEEHHDPIVSPALFDRVQQNFEKDRRISA